MLLYVWVISALLVICVLRYLKKYFWDYADMKGPSPLLSLPIFGHAWMLPPHPMQQMEKQREKYGNLIRFDIGPYPTLVIAGLEELQEMVKLDVFNGRFYGILPAVQTVFGTDSKGEIWGVSASNGQVWAEQRKFMHKNLNQAGMGQKNAMEDIIAQEARTACDRLATLSAMGPIPIRKFFPVAINNVVWRMISGKSSRQDDPFLLYLTECMNRHFESLAPSNMAAILLQYFHRLTVIMDKLNLPTCFKDLHTIKKTLDQELKKAVPDAQGTYIEKFKAEILAASSNPDSSFHGDDGHFHLSGHAADLFVAGTETTATFLEWAILYMVKYPKVQERISRELESVCGSNPPRLEQEQDLPYTRAVIQEITRQAPMMFTSVPRFNSEDTTFRGIHIPKHTQIMPCFSAINHDPKVFPSPNTFDPNRFLDENNQFIRHDHVIMFGLGKRKCVGEVLARAEIFLFLTYIVQRYQLITSVPGQEVTLDFDLGLAIHPKPFDIQIIPR